MNAAPDEEGRRAAAADQKYPVDMAETETETETFSQGERLSALLFMLEDLERSRQQIEHASREWIASMDAITDPIFLHDREFRILRCNKAYQQRAGISFHEIIGQLYYEVFPKNHEPLPCCLRAIEKAEEEEEEEVAIGDAIYRSRTFSIHDEQGVYLYSVHVLEDITAVRRAEAMLRESEEKFRRIGESAQDAIIMMAGKHISFWNAAAERIFGYTAAEALGQDLHALIVPEPACARFAQAFPHFQANGGGAIIGKVIEVIALRKGGEEFPVELSVSASQFGGQWHAIGIVRDITQRKRAEKELRLRAQLLDSTADSIFVANLEGNFVYLNEAAWKSRGYTRDELMGMNLHALDVPEYEELIEARVRELMEKGQSTFESAHRCKDGFIMPVEVSARIIESGGRKLVLAAVRDITKRKRAEAAIQHANRALATLSTVNRTLVRAASEDELLQSICHAIVQQHGYRLAWVGYKQHDENKSIRIMACAGYDEGYLDAMRLTWAETERGMGPSGRAIRSGTTQLCQDMANDPSYLPWRAAASQRGYASDIALPLTRESGEVFGILHVYSGETNAFAPAEITLLEEMAGDMAFGVNSLHIRRERDLAQDKIRQQLVQLQDSLEDTVRAIATIVEMRDPYTAGHQVKVADLAAAIARQLGLPEEQVHAIHLAGIVHDLGKIQVPAEILSKPGKITDLEFGLIKVHPQAGYDILKGIAFPWPIAQMVLQHHERLDGSGYPQGLKGEAILLEARILAVADAVEAISAHRPYRPGFGAEVALEEIAKQRGTHFDPQVVDACLTLFRERGYRFA